MASLASKHIGQDVPYNVLASALDVDTKSVEVWVIDGELGH